MMNIGLVGILLLGLLSVGVSAQVRSIGPIIPFPFFKTKDSKSKKVKQKDQYDYVIEHGWRQFVKPAWQTPIKIWKMKKGTEKFLEVYKEGKISKVGPYLEWTNPENKNKSCDEVCPYDLGMFQQFSKRMIPSNDDFLLSFTNDKGVFTESYSRTVGYCWGHSTLTRNFNYLALFDYQNDFKSKVPKESETKKWIKYYQNKLKRIAQGKAEIIPYFKNLYEISNHPLLVESFKKEVIDNWLTNTVHLKNLGHAKDFLKRRMKPNEVTSKINQVEDSIRKGIMPKLIIFSKAFGYVHIVSAFDVRRSGDQVKICLLDNHQFSDGLKDCQASLDITKTSKGYELYYYGWDAEDKNVENGQVRLFNFSVDHGYESFQYLDNMNKMCRKLTQCKEKQ